MQKIRAALSLLYLCFTLLNLGEELVIVVTAKHYNRYDFPPGFVFGSSTSAYQVEGAAFEDGRKASIFDTFAHSGHLSDNGDVACDGYHKYKEDVKLMVDTGLEAYRFSISWSRLIPNGRGLVNSKGLEYYNNLINELTSYGIQPHATLMHMDVPQTLEDDYGGFLSRNIIKDFTTYADVCFREFGDRVKHWTTINEANIFVMGGYDTGNSPPSRCSSPFGKNCSQGDSTTEPYLVAHNALLAHASIARLYREKYQSKQHGFLGFSIFSNCYIPLTNTKEDVDATERSYDSFIGWFMHPLIYGDYSDRLKRSAGSRIPSFTKNESELVKGAFDFIGINYYNVALVKDRSNFTKEPRDYISDMGVFWIPYNDSGSQGGSGLPSGSSFPNTPWGLQGLLEYYKEAYNNPPIYIHENGQVINHDAGLNDPPRVEYLQSHIGSLLDALRNGSNTKGYFVWSFMDTFELLYGFKNSFGLYFVDLDDPKLTRYPKLSQRWYSGFLKGENVTIDDEGNQHQAEETSTTLRISHLDVDELIFAS